MLKIRLDELLVERGLVENLSQAQRLCMAGQVRVGGQVILSASSHVQEQALLVVTPGNRFVSRGGEKLEPALQAFGLSVLGGAVCADVGASTGGFTDCLLQHGACKVYAIDVGFGVLHWRLRNNARVIIMERTNARFVQLLPETVELVTIDASFISLCTLLPVVKGWFDGERGQVVALIKPQFEAGRLEVARGKGVVRDPQIHRRVLHKMIEFALHSGWGVSSLIRSPLLGPKGNTEFFIHLMLMKTETRDIGQMVSIAMGSPADFVKE
jgi:23S rRNA (cytidine1920-2'-O)/16S rRNA (cytidine1409-2'-O)-methyltransferase